mmetsp:Transcript_27189/g.63285  ORF Transcript_27189/g.63285 Transcript_27189/m.63285 type:complete len:224 (+) Transcript_27189:1453-2124(+)
MIAAISITKSKRFQATLALVRVVSANKRKTSSKPYQTTAEVSITKMARGTSSPFAVTCDSTPRVTAFIMMTRLQKVSKWKLWTNFIKGKRHALTVPRTEVRRPVGWVNLPPALPADTVLTWSTARRSLSLPYRTLSGSRTDKPLDPVGSGAAAEWLHSIPTVSVSSPSDEDGTCTCSLPESAPRRLPLAVMTLTLSRKTGLTSVLVGDGGAVVCCGSTSSTGR